MDTQPNQPTEQQRIQAAQQEIAEVLHRHQCAILPMLGVKPIATMRNDPPHEALIVAHWQIVAQ